MEVSGDRHSTVPWEPWGVDGGEKVKANTSLELFRHMERGHGRWSCGPEESFPENGRGRSPSSGSCKPLVVREPRSGVLSE